MWIVIARAPRPAAAYWPGRRWMAVLDALAWPCLAAIIALKAPFATGLVGPAVVGLAAVLAVRRFRMAIWCNPFYRFTTWRYGKLFLIGVLLGVLLKMTM